MSGPAPIIDTRTAADISRQLRELLPKYLGEGTLKREDGVFDSFTESLIAIFSRYSEIVIERLNRAPDKNFLAFLDLLGTSPLPPQPARVPLTFNLVPGSLLDARIPAGTQVAAPPGEDEEEPIVFETEHKFMVTVAQLRKLLLRDPEQDKHADHRALIELEASERRYVLQADRRTEHILYIGHSSLFNIPYTAYVALILTLDRSMEDDGKLAWEVWDGSDWREIQPEVSPTSHTQHLEQPQGSGNVTTLMFTGIAPMPVYELNINGKEKESRWLRCQLLTPITPEKRRRVGMVRSERLPTITQLRIEAHVSRDATEGLLAELAFANSLPIDASREFFPFGEQPKLYDTFYVASSEAFSKQDGTIVLKVEIDNPHHQGDASSIWASRDLQLGWECWGGNAWIQMGTSSSPEWLSLVQIESVDGPIIKKLESGATVTRAVVQGRYQEGVRLGVTGGEKVSSVTSEAIRFAAEVVLGSGYNVVYVRATLGAGGKSQSTYAVVLNGTPDPEVYLEVLKVSVDNKKAELTVKVSGGGTSGVAKVRAVNGTTEDEVTATPTGGNATLIMPLAHGRNTLLIRALDSSDKTLAAQTHSVGLANPTVQSIHTDTGSDGTHALCQSGEIRLQLPESVAKTPVNGQAGYWLRARLLRGDYGKAAAYRLKNPLDAGEGYALTPETFRPPVIGKLTIGYEQTVEGVSELTFAANGGQYKRVAFANEPLKLAFPPFVRDSETAKTLYFGFGIPEQLTRFPNSTVTLFSRVADFDFAEKSVPLSPFRSELWGNAGDTLKHRFVVTNPYNESDLFKFELFGMQVSWRGSVTPEEIELAGGSSIEVEVEVRIPATAKIGDWEQGFMRLSNENLPVARFSAAFLTRVGTKLSSREPAKLVWEYWNGEQWSGLAVRDDTELLTRSGAVTFLATADFSPKEQFGSNHYWLRARWESGQYTLEPRLDWIRLNTTMASQSVTLRNEVLGSSNGTESQAFQCNRFPVLGGPRLILHELEQPSAEERTQLEKEEGEDAILESETAPVGTREIWVRWHEVTDFYASGPRDRHYVLDHQTGEVRFGDGQNGMIPPLGKGNVRMAVYRTGGGVKGNRDVGTIVQLKTTLPYVESVVNLDASAGGADTERQEIFVERAPRTIRHRGRAVTVEDYEDLAKLASPRVARSKGVPLFHLALDPDAGNVHPGVVSVIIVPDSDETNPSPSQELATRVQDYLGAHSLPTVQVVVVGPEYIRVDVEVEIVVTSLDVVGQVMPTVESELNGFLHPLNGGADRKGWDFGRIPKRSDFYALIEKISGVKYVRTLDWTKTPEREGLLETERFLIHAGTHAISLVFEEA